MSYIDLARDWLRRDEGVVPHVYQDSEGYWTIGCGRLVDKRLGGGLSDYEINVLLNADILKAEIDARELFPSFDRLSEARKAVLISMAFNLGKPRLAGFRRLREAVEAEAWEQAAAEMRDSLWYRQVTNRAERLAKQMADG